jgi:cytochrome c-type biogenesis protein CcmF
MLGHILVYVAFGLSVLSGIFYFVAKNNQKLLKLGRYSYYGMTASMLAIAMYLLSNILSHNFQMTYVWEYSSTTLPLNLLISTFYAGQQGSFLLWSLMLTLIGFFLIPYLKERNYENITMGIFVFVIAFILLILIFKSPFDYVWQTYAEQGVKEGFTPKEGRGLNPILQNYWINIHPPILFLGYSLMTVPYIFAISGLLKKDYRKWIRLALPWTLFACAVLGLGLMLGGLWAYETLGWGGFWAWDPVENSSLIPWLSAVTLVHTMYIHQKTGGLIKTNFVIAFFTFLFVLYASFLTRSGVLGDTSVHSFVSPGPIIYNMLLIFMGIFLIVAVVSLFLRLKNIQSPDINFKVSSKEFVVSVGIIVLILITFIVLFGTSWPIITGILGITKSSVEAKWYNQLNLPLATLILIFSSISLYFSWKKTDFSKFLSKAVAAIIAGILFAILTVVLGIDKFTYILVAFSVGFALYVNFEFISKNLRKDKKLIGGFLSHSGLALLVLGALASGAYSDSIQVSMRNGQYAEFKGYKIVHNGKERIELEKHDMEKYRYNVDIIKAGDTTRVHPVAFWSDYNDMETPYFEPGIKPTAFKDIYISMSLAPHYKVEPVALRKQLSAKVSLDTTYTMKMLDFLMLDMKNGATNDSSGNQKQMMKIGVLVRLSNNSGYIKEDTIFATMNMQNMTNIPTWYDLDTTGVQIGFMQIMPDKENLANSGALFMFKKKGGELEMPEELLILDISDKPFINLVWIGTIFVVVGFIISLFKYMTPKQLRKAFKKDIEFEKAEEKNLELT